VIAVCNPNNPTGHILTPTEREAIIQAADEVGAWILADEVYSGTERLSDEQTPSLWGQTERVIATNSLSKAYGLPGLRTGWVVAPANVVQDIWRRHEYTTIATTMLANHLAAVALSPKTRARLLRRTREHVRQGYEILGQWLDDHRETFSLIPPKAAAVAFARYHLNINSVALVERLRNEKSVLMIPGDYFGMNGFVRIGFGAAPEPFMAALERVHELVVELQEERKWVVPA
jgi:aspartate/methionine/tyrosine aminotransferase